MATESDTTTRPAAGIIRAKIERGGERIWRYKDFEGLSPTAVAQTLSRLAREGTLERLANGTYYRPRETAFGKSRPNPAQLRKLATERKGVFPAGISAANHLGFSTQNPARIEVATYRSSLPRKLLGEHAIVHTRRPRAWRQLRVEDAALLEFLRNRGETSELSPKATVNRTIQLMKEPDRLSRILKVADTEPPRVRAMLGAIVQQCGASQAVLDRVRRTLNPLSRFEFGSLAPLKYAQQWQAKKRVADEAI